MSSRPDGPGRERGSRRRPPGSGRSLARRSADAVRRALLDVLENEQVAALPGLMQGLDPRVKLLTLLLLAVTASFLHTLPSLALATLLPLALAAASRISVASLLRKVWATAGLLTALLAVPAAMAWITPGRALVPLGPLSITDAGCVVALRLVLRAVAGASLGLLIVWATRWSDLLRALSWMRVPDMVVATLAMTRQQLLSLLRTVEDLHLARESRMLGPASTREERTWVTGRIAFVAARSLHRADEVYRAMLARGFTGRMPSLSALRTRPRDWLWLAGAVMASAALVLLDRTQGVR